MNFDLDMALNELRTHLSIVPANADDSWQPYFDKMNSLKERIIELLLENDISEFCDHND